MLELSAPQCRPRPIGNDRPETTLWRFTQQISAPELLCESLALVDWGDPPSALIMDGRFGAALTIVLARECLKRPAAEA